MENMTAQLIAAEKKSITQMLKSIDDVETIHKAWSILNRYTSRREREAKKGGAKA